MEFYWVDGYSSSVNPPVGGTGASFHCSSSRLHGRSWLFQFLLPGQREAFHSFRFQERASVAAAVLPSDSCYAASADVRWRPIKATFEHSLHATDAARLGLQCRIMGDWPSQQCNEPIDYRPISLSDAKCWLVSESTSVVQSYRPLPPDDFVSRVVDEEPSSGWCPS